MSSETSRFAGIADLVPTLITLVDRNTFQIVDINEYGLTLMGYSRDELVGMDYRTIIHEIDYRPDRVSAMGRSDTVVIERRLACKDGRFVNFMMSGRVLPDEPELLLLDGRPLDDLAEADSSLADLLLLAELTNDLLVVYDIHGGVRYANKAAWDLHGIETLDGANYSDFIHENDNGRGFQLAADALENRRASGRSIGLAANGDPLIFSVEVAFDPERERWYSVQRDVRELVAQEERLERLTKDLEHRAATDDLTGVANRPALNAIVESALEAEEPFGLLMLDMDDFKSVNDTLGHAAGDALLKIVALRLTTIAGEEATVARIGGDEFVMFLPNVDETSAALIAAQVVDSIASPFKVQGVTIGRSCSIGVALSEPGDDPSAVLLRADQAAYEAKHAGRSRFSVHGGTSNSWPTEVAATHNGHRD